MDDSQILEEIGRSGETGAVRKPPAEEIPSSLPSPHGDGGGGGEPKVSISLDSLHVATVIECSAPAETG